MSASKKTCRRSKVTRFNKKYLVILIMAITFIYGYLNLSAIENFLAKIREPDTSSILAVGYSTEDGSIVMDTEGVPKAPPLLYKNCGKWVPEGTEHSKDEVLEQFMACKPEGFMKKGGIAYIYKRSIRGTMPNYRMRI